MTASLKSVNTADLESIDTSDPESPNAVNPQPGGSLEGGEKSVQRVLEGVSCSVMTESPDIVVKALINVQSIIQREIDSLVKQRDRGSHEKREAGAPEVPPSPPEVPQIPKVPKVSEVPEPANPPEEEEVPSNVSNGIVDQDNVPDKSEPDDEESDSIDECALEKPVYDNADGIYRCINPACGWEVAFGYCHGCHTKYMMEDDEDEAVDPTNSLTVFKEGILVPRGSSPPPKAIPDYLCPSEYSRDPQEFDELISRGATLAFCQAWKASFEKDRGIVVQADNSFLWAWGFREEWDSWEIWIGRRIKLGKHDTEGNEFMGDLMDLISTEDDDGLWITYKEREDPPRWVTRPKEGPEITKMVEPVEVADEYEWWSSGEEDDPELSSVGSFTDDGTARSTSNPATSDCESTWWPDDSENEAEGEVQADEAAEENKGGPTI